MLVCLAERRNCCVIPTVCHGRPVQAFAPSRFRKQAFFPGLEQNLCGKTGIRTPETLLRFTRFPGVPLQPLEHLSFVGSGSPICFRPRRNWAAHTSSSSSSKRTFLDDFLCSFSICFAKRPAKLHKFFQSAKLFAIFFVFLLFLATFSGILFQFDVLNFDRIAQEHTGVVPELVC